MNWSTGLAHLRRWTIGWSICTCLKIRRHDRPARVLVELAVGEAPGRSLRWMNDQVRLPCSDEMIALEDGTPWIRNQIEFHGLMESIRLDFYHLREDAQKALRNLVGEESE